MTTALLFSIIALVLANIYWTDRKISNLGDRLGDKIDALRKDAHDDFIEHLRKEHHLDA